MHILKATDYGFRKVIRVVLDDAVPEWVHPDGSPHTDATGRGPETVEVDGNPQPGALTAGLAPGTECHECRYGWTVREFTFTGSELYKGKRLKTNAELKAEVLAQLAPKPAPKAIAALEGATL